MEEIVSKQDNSKILHVIFRKQDFIQQPRIDLTSASQSLQVSALNMALGKKVFPHKHLPVERHTIGTQESIIVIAGSIKISYYDLDDSKLEDSILKEGDCSVTFNGAHALEVLEDNTLLYELKNGPYLGKEHDYRLL